MPEILQMRLLDPDDCPDTRPKQRRSFEEALKQALLKTYPVAPVVEEVDDVFVRLLEKLATLDLGKKQPGQGLT